MGQKIRYNKELADPANQIAKTFGLLFEHVPAEKTNTQTKLAMRLMSRVRVRGSWNEGLIE
jgi:hypothetical protein